MLPRLVTAAVSTLFVAAAQSTHSSVAPRFEDYPVREIFRAAPAAPLLVTKEEQLYRTRIRNGVLKGEVAADWESEPKPGV